MVATVQPVAKLANTADVKEVHRTKVRAGYRMDRCIATVQRTIAAAADSAVLLTEANQRWEADRQHFEAEKETWTREKEELASQAIQNERIIAAQKKELKRLTNGNIRLNMTLRDHLSHLHGDDRGGSGAGGGGGGRRDHTSVGDRSDDAHSRRRDKTAPPPANPPPVNPPPALNAATSAGASTTSCSRSKDHRQQNGNSSADEIDTPTAGLGPGGRRIRRRPREWPDVPGTMPVMPTGRALDNGEVLEPRQDEVGAGVGRVGESSSARAAVTGGGDTDYSNVRSREQQANRKVGGGSRGRDDETRPIEKMRPDYPATAAGSGKGGGDTRSARRSSSGAMTVNYQHGSAILSARVPRRNMSPLPSTSAHLSSGRKRSRLELGDSNRYVAYEEGVLGGKRHETSRRHVMVEMPDIRRRPSPCTTRAGRELQAAAIDQGPATAAAGSGSRRKSSTTASALQFNQRPPLPSRAPNGGVSDMSVEDRSGGDDAGGDDSDVAEDHRGEPAGKDWIQCIETGTPPMTRAPSLGPTSEQASAGRNRPISTSISEHGAGRGANAKLRDDAYRLPSAVSVMPLATRSGENRAGGERGDHSAGEESAEQTLYPQLTMAVVSPKKQSKRLHQHQHRQRHGIENTTNRSNSPMSSREQRNEANVTVGSNGSGGGDGSESRGDSSGGGGGASDGKQFGGVGNVYHPEERGLGWGRSGRAEAHSPKPHKYQEVVRGRDERAAMKGHDCEHCTAYVEAIGGTPGTRQAMLNMCSRHKHKEAQGPPPETPEGFWDLSFADSINRKEQERAAVAQTGKPPGA